MRIGIDFDNTIVSYDAVFHRVALERELIPASLPVSKLSVRDFLRQAGKEDVWTEMQGYVYGTRMRDAAAYPGAIDFFVWARTQGVVLAIVSHKTRYPYLGERYDLHAAARGWVNSVLVERRQPLVDIDDVYFELTKQDKLERITRLELDWFIDDLPEILLAAEFPAQTGRMLFDSDGSHLADPRLVAFPAWESIQEYFQQQWTTQT